MVPENIQIIDRFFIALDALVDKGYYDSYYDFALQNGFDRSQLMKSKNDHASRRFEVAWIAPLIEKHDLNASWLFTGRGSRFLKSSKALPTKGFAKQRFVSIEG